MLYLVTYWYFLVCTTRSESDEEAAVARLFGSAIPADAAGAAARRAVDRALIALGLPAQAVAAVLPAMWAERALYTRRRRAALGAPVVRTRPEAFLQILAELPSGMLGRDG